MRLESGWEFNKQMPVETQLLLSVALYKVTSLLVGVAFSYMGYRLFNSGVWGNAGTFTAQHKDNKLILKNAAPGTFFAMFGAIIVVVTLVKGLEFRRYGDEIQPNEQTVNVAIGDREDLPNDPPF